MRVKRGEEERFWKSVELARLMVGERLGEGDVAVDATAGNGRDTAFLAGCVGATGKVYAFDVQGEALEATRKKLKNEGLEGRVRLVEADHAEMPDRMDAGDVGRVRAVMFNLGYLPGGDKSVVTRPGSTLAAVRGVLGRVAGAGAVVTVVVYTGHAGGRDESEALENWVATGMPDRVECVRYEPLGRTDAPYLLAFRRRGFRTNGGR